MSLALKLSDEEWLSAIKITPRGTVLWWERTPAKAIRFRSREAAEALAGFADRGPRRHQVVEVA